MGKGTKDVGIGLVGAPACGDVMKLSIKVNEEGVIEDVRFKTFGCGSAIASSSFMTERVKGMTLDEAAAIKNAIKDYRKNRLESGNTKQGHIEIMQDAATGQ